MSNERNDKRNGHFREKKCAFLWSLGALRISKQAMFKDKYVFAGICD